MAMTASIIPLKPIHPSASSMVRFGLQSPSTISPRGQVELSDNQPPGIPIDMYQGDITQCPVDAIVVGVYNDEDVFRKIRDKLWKQPNRVGEDSHTHETVQPLRGEAGKVDKALNGAILKSLSATEPLSYCVLNTGDLENWPLVLSKGKGENWGIPAKHVIVVGLGDRLDSTWGAYSAMKTLQRAHKKALVAIDGKMKIKTVATALHCADTGVFNTREELGNATRMLKDITEEYAQRYRYDGRPFQLQKLSIVSEHPKLPTLVTRQPYVTMSKTNECGSPEPIPQHSEPVHSNFLQRTWNNLQSLFSSLWETIKRVFGFGSTSAKA